MEAKIYRNAYVDFNIKVGLVLLSFIAYKYVIKDEKIDSDSLLLLLGWACLLLSSQLSTVDLDPFSLLLFFSFITIKILVYLFWTGILLRRWWVGNVRS
jgi:hypothetical protein